MSILRAMREVVGPAGLVIDPDLMRGHLADWRGAYGGRAVPAGLLFPLALGSEGSATIGGNLATNAGGTAVPRYGTMRDLTLGLEVVLCSASSTKGRPTVRWCVTRWWPARRGPPNCGRCARAEASAPSTASDSPNATQWSKHLLDPAGLMNPGKVLPDRAR